MATRAAEFAVVWWTEVEDLEVVTGGGVDEVVGGGGALDVATDVEVAVAVTTCTSDDVSCTGGEIAKSRARGGVYAQFPVGMGQELVLTIVEARSVCLGTERAKKVKGGEGVNVGR